jgi:Putative transposase of IS4/5 family (DUF4096)
MAKALLTDELWEVIEPLLCPTSLHKAQRWQGTRVADNRTALSAILFVLKSGIPSEMLCPRADGLLRASGMTSFCGASLSGRSGTRQAWWVGASAAADAVGPC